MKKFKVAGDTATLFLIFHLYLFRLTNGKVFVSPNIRGTIIMHNNKKSDPKQSVLLALSTFP